MKLLSVHLNSALRGRIATAASPDDDDDHLWLTRNVARRDVCCLTLELLRTQALELTVTVSADPVPTGPIWLTATAKKGNELGDPPPHRIDPGAWRNGIATCRISLSAPMANAVIGRQRGFWTWQWHYNYLPAASLGTSEHLLFSIGDLPTFPWTAAVKPRPDEANPWAGALALACDWAAGATSVQDVPERVAKATFELQRAKLPWKYSGSASFYMNPHLGPPWFRCAWFIRAVRKPRFEPRDPTSLSCYEASTVVTTFANVLGCSLRPMIISRGDCESFRLNPVWPMGGRPEKGVKFRVHVVACETGKAPHKEHAFDPVLRLDIDAKPAAPNHEWALTFDHRLGTTASPAGKRMYLPQLIAAADINSCSAVPLAIAHVAGPDVFYVAHPCSLFWWHYYLRELMTAESSGRALPITFSIPNFNASDTIRLPPPPERPGPLPAVPPWSRTTYTAIDPAAPDTRLAADFWSGAADETRSVMAELLARAEQPPMRVDIPGAILYRDERGETLWTLIDGAAVRLTSMGRPGVDLLAILSSAMPTPQ